MIKLNIKNLDFYFIFYLTKISFISFNKLTDYY